jgi:hypothetical protein
MDITHLLHITPSTLNPYEGPLLAHCGQWWPLLDFPMTLPCCGLVIWFEDTDDTEEKGNNEIPR